MKKTLAISALALGAAVLVAAGIQPVATAVAGETAVQEAQWRGDGGWHEGRHGRGWRDDRGGGRRGDRGRQMVNRFEAFDLNKDKAITQSEVDQFRQNQITEFDGDKNGTLSIDEYEALWLSVMRERMVDAFQDHDDDGDGQVTPGEFNERFTGMIERFDRNGDGQLTEDDYGRRRRGDAAADEPEDEGVPAPAPAEPAPAP